MFIDYACYWAVWLGGEGVGSVMGIAIDGLGLGDRSDTNGEIFEGMCVYTVLVGFWYARKRE